MRIEGSWDLKERGFGEAWARRRIAGLYAYSGGEG